MKTTLLSLAEVAAILLRGAIRGRLQVVSEAQAAGIPVLRFAARVQLCHLKAWGVLGDRWEFGFVFFNNCLCR